MKRNDAKWSEMKTKWSEMKQNEDEMKRNEAEGNEMKQNIVKYKWMK